MKHTRMYVLGFNMLVLVSLLWPASAALGAKMSYRGTEAKLVRRAQTFPARYFAPYDYVNPGSGDFVQAAQQTDVKYYSLAFILSNGGCQATWQGSGSAVSSSDAMKTDIDRLRQLGGDVIISFGGYGGTELARACQDASSLQKQYQSIIDAYDVNHLDFDLEGGSETDILSIDRRSQAIAALEQANPGLTISYTLSVETPNLHLRTPQFVTSAKKYNVKIDVVNIMTMDYTPNIPATKMGIDALVAVQNVKKDLLSIGLLTKIGITPMIGVNDHSPEVFTKQDTQQIIKYAEIDRNIAELSMWSLERDVACPGGATGGGASSSCSGVEQQQYDFMKAFNTFTGNSTIPIPIQKVVLPPKPQPIPKLQQPPKFPSSSAA